MAEKWEGTKINSGYQHEGLDRVHCIQVYIDSVIGSDGDCHPSIHNDRCKEHLYKAQMALAKLYQEIGAWDGE